MILLSNYLKDGRPEDGVPVMPPVWPVEGQQAHPIAQDTSPGCPGSSLAEEALKRVTRYLMLLIRYWLPASFPRSPPTKRNDRSFNLG